MLCGWFKGNLVVYYVSGVLCVCVHVWCVCICLCLCVVCVFNIVCMCMRAICHTWVQYNKVGIIHIVKCQNRNYLPISYK